MARPNLRHSILPCIESLDTILNACILYQYLWYKRGTMKYASNRLRAVLTQANLEAEALRHDYVGTEHLLLSLLKEDEGPASQVLKALGVGRAELRRGLLKLVRPGKSTAHMSKRPYTSRVKKVLEYAVEDARDLPGGARRGSDVQLDTQHLLAGLAMEEKGLAAQALASFGVNPVAVRQLSLGRRPSASLPAEPEETVWFVEIDPDSVTPIYEQLIAGIEEAVATNLLLSGERLPPVRELAAELGIAPGTVARAYSELEKRGILTTEGARGTRVAEHSPRSTGTEDFQPALADLLRPVAVAAYHMGALGEDLHTALDLAMRDIFTENRE